MHTNMSIWKQIDMALFYNFSPHVHLQTSEGLSVERQVFTIIGYNQDYTSPAFVTQINMTSIDPDP